MQGKDFFYSLPSTRIQAFVANLTVVFLRIDVNTHGFCGPAA